MSEKTIESYGKGFLVLLLPASFLTIFLIATWKIWVALILLLFAFNMWQYHRWQQWCQQANPIFNQLIQENQGRITPIDLAVKGNFSGEMAKRYLDSKSVEFGARALQAEDGSNVYYFITASTLGSILDSSEPPKEETFSQPVTTVLPFLAPPPPNQEREQELEPETESLKQPTEEEVKRPLEQQLVFGSLIQSELAKRLNVYSSTVYKRREDPDFPEWSRSKDPDRIAWTYSTKTKEFFPQEEGKS